MHLKLIFCIVLLQLLLTVKAQQEEDIDALKAGESDAPPGTEAQADVQRGESNVPDIDAKEVDDAKVSDKKVKLSGTRMSRGLPCAAERAVAVDLTRGWCRYLPRSTREACWTVFPRCTCQRCNMQGVMKFAQPYWAHVLTVLLVFENPCKYSFNLGNSPGNNGWGGDGSMNPWDAEIHNFYHQLFLWRNQFACNGLLYFNQNAVKTALLIRIYQFGVYLTNYEGLSVWICSNRFFKMWPRNYVYMGFNRVIKHAHGGPSPPWRTGSGLCYMSLFWSW